MVASAANDITAYYCTIGFDFEQANASRQRTSGFQKIETTVEPEAEEAQDQMLEGESDNDLDKYARLPCAKRIAIQDEAAQNRF